MSAIYTHGRNFAALNPEIHTATFGEIIGVFVQNTAHFCKIVVF
jgi:hypothetical protein